MYLQIETYHILTRFDMQICCYGLFLIQSAGKADRHCVKWNWMCESVDKELHGNGYLWMFIVSKCKGGKSYLDWYSLLFILFECPLITILNVYNEKKAVGNILGECHSWKFYLFIYLFILLYLLLLLLLQALNFLNDWKLWPSQRHLSISLDPGRRLSNF
jgi:hypothetical protein